MNSNSFLGLASEDTDMSTKRTVMTKRTVIVPSRDATAKDIGEAEMRDMATVYVYDVFYAIATGEPLDHVKRTRVTVLAFGLENAIDKARRYMDRKRISNATIVGIERVATVDVP